VPSWQVRHLRNYGSPTEIAEIENKHRATLAQIVGGAVVLAGVVISWHQLTAGMAATRQSQELDKERLITDRFLRAVEQLGNRESLDVRLGGIHALGRIARDSKKDHWTVMEVLTAHVRENAKWGGGAPSGGAEGENGDEASERHRPKADIQAILTVVGRRRTEFEEGQDVRLDLSGTYLRGAVLTAADLARADLSPAHLAEADLSLATLSGANLLGADLRRADLGYAILDGANLKCADLRHATLPVATLAGANLTGANLGGVELSYADVASAYLNGADLRYANLNGARLYRSQLDGAGLRHAILTRANLDGADLSRADLSDADLGGACLTAANLSRANLTDADLTDADLSSADLSGAKGLTREQIESAITDEDTKLPDYLTQDHDTDDRNGSEQARSD
jgi:uncharacterized protein YjbI with pentapeptide repeats